MRLGHTNRCTQNTAGVGEGVDIKDAGKQSQAVVTKLTGKKQKGAEKQWKGAVYPPSRHTWSRQTATASRAHSAFKRTLDGDWRRQPHLTVAEIRHEDYDGAEAERMLKPVVAGMPASSWLATDNNAERSAGGDAARQRG